MKDLKIIFNSLVLQMSTLEPAMKGTCLSKRRICVTHLTLQNRGFTLPVYLAQHHLAAADSSVDTSPYRLDKPITQPLLLCSKLFGLFLYVGSPFPLPQALATNSDYDSPSFHLGHLSNLYG